jgi:hypothetical protein
LVGINEKKEVKKTIKSMPMVFLEWSISDALPNVWIDSTVKCENNERIKSWGMFLGS